MALTFFTTQDTQHQNHGTTPHTRRHRGLNHEGRSKSSRPDLVLFEIKLNTTCTIRLLGYKYFVHFSIWTRPKCLSDGIENASTRTAHKFLKTSQTIPTWPSKNLFHNSLLRMKRGSTTSILSQNQNHAMERNEIGQKCHFITLRNSVFSMSNANNRRRLKCTKYF